MLYRINDNILESRSWHFKGRREGTVWRLNLKKNYNSACNTSTVWNVQLEADILSKNKIWTSVYRMYPHRSAPCTQHPSWPSSKPPLKNPQPQIHLWRSKSSNRSQFINATLVNILGGFWNINLPRPLIAPAQWRENSISRMFSNIKHGFRFKGKFVVFLCLLHLD